MYIVGFRDRSAKETEGGPGSGRTVDERTKTEPGTSLGGWLGNSREIVLRKWLQWGLVPGQDDGQRQSYEGTELTVGGD